MGSIFRQFCEAETVAQREAFLVGRTCLWRAPFSRALTAAVITSYAEYERPTGGNTLMAVGLSTGETVDLGNIYFPTSATEGAPSEGQYSPCNGDLALAQRLPADCPVVTSGAECIALGPLQFIKTPPKEFRSGEMLNARALPL